MKFSFLLFFAMNAIALNEFIYKYFSCLRAVKSRAYRVGTLEECVLEDYVVCVRVCVWSLCVSPQSMS